MRPGPECLHASDRVEIEVWDKGEHVAEINPLLEGGSQGKIVG